MIERPFVTSPDDYRKMIRMTYSVRRSVADDMGMTSHDYEAVPDLTALRHRLSYSGCVFMHVGAHEEN